jgi:hypothetical protein
MMQFEKSSVIVLLRSNSNYCVSFGFIDVLEYKTNHDKITLFIDESKETRAFVDDLLLH